MRERTILRERTRYCIIENARGRKEDHLRWFWGGDSESYTTIGVFRFVFHGTDNGTANGTATWRI